MSYKSVMMIVKWCCEFDLVMIQHNHVHHIWCMSMSCANKITKPIREDGNEGPKAIRKLIVGEFTVDKDGKPLPEYELHLRSALGMKVASKEQDEESSLQQ